MVKLYQVKLEEGEQVVGFDFETYVEKDEINADDKKKKQDEIRQIKSSRIKIITENESVGLLLNNNPYLIVPTFTNGEWELDTKDNIWITSVKFEEEYKEPIVIEFYYED